MPLPGAGTFSVQMDLLRHEAVIETSGGNAATVSMSAGLTGTEFGDRLIDALRALGVEADYAREKFVSDEAREYDPAAAAAFLNTIVNIDHNLEVHRSSLTGPVGPLQIWPHGFDLAFEWFGTRTERHEEHGEIVEMAAQLNLGFYPGGRAYFYSNPWPFEGEVLTAQALPEPAAWHTEGWEGSILYYDDLLATDDPPRALVDYARAVYEAAIPTLSSG
jgi:hypothetical protein